MSTPKDPVILSNEEMLREFYHATHIPVSLFHEGALLKRYAGEVPDLNLPLFLQSQLPADLPPLWITHIERDVWFGGICAPGMDILIFLGPVLPFDCPRTLATHLVEQLGQKPQTIATLTGYFHECGLHTSEDLISALRLFSRLFHLFPQDSLPSDGEYMPLQVELIPFSWQTPFPAREQSAGETHAQEDLLLERRMLSYVRHGQTAPFEEMKQNISSFVGKDTQIPAPLHKLYITQAVTLASRAAIGAGVDPDLVYSMLSDYFDTITASSRPQDYVSIFPDSYLAFAREVARANQLAGEDALTRRIHRYISGHIHEKITPTIIAEATGYNTSYLCAQFKKNTGKTISTYINECKIDEAKLLLESSNVPISDIAIQLGYPSQGYFCTLFKKYTQRTPTEYRETIIRRSPY